MNNKQISWTNIGHEILRKRRLSSLLEELQPASFAIESEDALQAADLDDAHHNWHKHPEEHKEGLHHVRVHHGLHTPWRGRRGKRQKNKTDK